MINGLHFCLFLHMHKTILGDQQKGLRRPEGESVGWALAPLALAQDGRLFIG
jgi:hypothetical protein